MKLSVRIVFMFTLAVSGYAQIPAGKTEFFTEYGILTLNFNGRKVTGSYPHENGKITALVKDTLLIGTWSQSDGGGDIEFHFNQNFSKFRIRYNHSATPDSTGAIWKKDWTGMRKPETSTMRYKSPFGVMTLNITGTQVEGSYPLYNGKIMGELVDKTFEGIWLQSNRGFGTLKINFSQDFSSFQGTYNDYNFHPDKWYDWKGVLMK